MASQPRPAAPPLRIASRPRRPRPSLFVGGVLVVLASVVGVGTLLHGVSGEHAILVLARTVPAGQQISASDLRSLNISRDTGDLSVIETSQEASVVGQPAAVTLPEGSPVLRSDLGPLQLPADQTLLGVLAKPGQYPPSVAPGDHVLVLDTTVASGNGAAVPAATSGPVSAVVIAVDAPNDTSTQGQIISLRLSTSAAQLLAPAAASGHLTILVVASRG